MADDGESKKHEASAHKKREQKKKGNVAKSQDVTITTGLVAGFGTIIAMHSFYLTHLKEVFEFSASQLQYTDKIDLHHCLLFVMEQVGYLSLPVLCAVMVLGVAAQFGMVGFIFTGEQLKPSIEKINPMKGLKRWFEIRSLVELGKSLVKVLLTFAVGGSVLWGAVDQIRTSVNLDAAGIMGLGGHLIMSLFWRVLILFVVVAVTDYFFQRWNWNKQQKMTDKEVRDEYKEQEGDPYMKSQRRQMARQIANQAATQDNVPYSDAVVINPTMLAIAIKYDPQVSPVPYVVAKGDNRLADEIREVANKSGVPVVRNKPLARGLFETCEVGDIVPPDLYKPVAEVLAYVFSLKESASPTAASAQAVTGNAPTEPVATPV